MCTLHEDRYTYMITSRLILLRIRNVWDKICGVNQNIYFMFNNLLLFFFFFRKSCRLWIDAVNAVDQDKLQMTIWHMRIECWIPKATSIHREYVTITAFFHSNQGCTNSPQSYVIHSLPVFFVSKMHVPFTSFSRILSHLLCHFLYHSVTFLRLDPYTALDFPKPTIFFFSGEY